jgi:hypothetical protein
VRGLPVLLFLTCAVVLEAADAPNLENELRNLIGSKFKLAIVKISCREYNPPLDNGMTGGACIELKDATTAFNSNVVIKRSLSLHRWDAKVIEKSLSHRHFNGWYVPENLDEAVSHWVFGKFEIKSKVAAGQVPANMSYDFVKECLTFAFDSFDIEKTHEVQWDQEAKTIVIRTLLEFKGNLNAYGEVYHIKLDDNKRPTEIKKMGIWRA